MGATWEEDGSYMGATVELAQTNYTKQKGKKWQKSSKIQQLGRSAAHGAVNIQVHDFSLSE